LDRCLELDGVAKVKSIGYVIRVSQNLGLPRVPLGPVPLLLEILIELIGVLHALYVAPSARIPVPVPGAADASRTLVDTRVEAELAHPMQHVHARESGANNDHVMVGDLWRITHA
jgi:hypothetical protein